MKAAECLRRVTDPFLSMVADDRVVATEALGWQGAGLVVRAVRGRKARTLPAFFDEFSAAFQFPYYFGENWAAFSECISDLEWLALQSGVVVLIYDADQLLFDAHPAELSALVRALSLAACEFARPVDDGEAWDRAPVPFHVVLQGSSEGDFGRWRDAGGTLARLVV